MQVRDCMTEAPHVCGPDVKICDAARVMAEGDFGAIPVLENGQAIGIITDRDIAIRAVARERSATETTVRDVMSRRCIGVREDDDVEEALRVMEDNQIRRLVVTDANDQICGILSTADIALGLHDAEKEAELLEQVSKRAA